MMYCRGTQAWYDSRDLENGDTRCGAKECEYEMIRERTQDDREGPGL